jgi:hypothetical protein
MLDFELSARNCPKSVKHSHSGADKSPSKMITFYINHDFSIMLLFNHAKFEKNITTCLNFPSLPL